MLYPILNIMNPITNILRASGVFLLMSVNTINAFTSSANDSTKLKHIDANDFLVQGIEITQSIQNFAQGIPLIANKRTLVRVYLSYPQIAGSVRGVLKVMINNTGNFVSVQSLNVLAPNHPMNSKINRKRMDLSQSINFELPRELLAEGSYSYSLKEVINVASNQSMTCPNCLNISVADVMEPALRISTRLIGLKYSQRDGRTTIQREPREIDVKLTRSWLGRAYPTGNLDFSYQVMDAQIPWPFTCDQANARIAAIRNQDIAAGGNRVTHYYGLVSDEGGFMRGGAASIPGRPDASVVASGPTGVPGGDVAWDTDNSYGDWYTGHELGHTFGRTHPGFCEQDDDDPDPLAMGRIMLDDSAFVALDFGDVITVGGVKVTLPMRVSGLNWNDVMTYCENQWLSGYTYLAILARCRAETETATASMGSNALAGAAINTGSASNAAGSSALRNPILTGEFISITATLNLKEGTGKLVATDRVARGIVSDESNSGRVLIRLKDTEEKIILKYKAPIKFNTDIAKGADSTGIVDCIIPYLPQTRRIELVINNKVVDSRKVTSGIPTEAQNSRGVIKDLSGNVNILWRANDPDNNRLRYHVLVSKDSGNSWYTIVYDSPNTSYSISKDEYGDSGEPLLFRVIATDGFNNKLIRQDTVKLE